MKTRLIKIALTAASLLLAANLAFAVEAVGDAAKTTKDTAKGAVADTKAGAAAAKDTAKAKAKTAVTDTKAAAKAPAAAAKASATGNLIDINTASEAELKAIPGIGDAYAAKIVAGRPYAKKDQLKSRNILPAPAYEKVKEKIIAKKAAKPAVAKKK